MVCSPSAQWLPTVEGVKVAGMCHRSGASSCPQPRALEVAVEKPAEGLERHHAKQDILCCGAARGAGSLPTVSMDEVGGIEGKREGGMEGSREAGTASWGAQRNRHSVIPGRKL